MKVKFTEHALGESMPDEGITKEEVITTLRKSERTVKLPKNKFKFLYRDLEVVAQRDGRYWKIITCYRVK